MELKITGTEVEQKPIHFNYDELKTQITEKAELYKNMVYDENQVKEAKADRATLNKFKSALEGKRRDVKKECLKPFEEFEAQVNDLIRIIDEPIKLIDTQVKNYEEEEKQQKAIAIHEKFNDMEFPDFVKFEMISNPKWLNKSVSIKKITEELVEERQRVESAVQTLESLPDFGFEAMEEYKKTLDLGRAIAEGQRLADIQKRKEEAEAERKRLEAEAEARRLAEESRQEEVVVEVVDKPETVITPKEEVETVAEEIPEEFVEKQWVTFKALVTVEQAGILGDFCRSNNIELEIL